MALDFKPEVEMTLEKKKKTLETLVRKNSVGFGNTVRMGSCRPCMEMLRPAYHQRVSMVF